MSEQIGLNKTVFDRNSFLNTVNTSFSEISNPAIIVEALPTVAEFFQNYQQLFYNIPVEGGSNSHEYLVKVSGQYINAENFDENLQHQRPSHPLPTRKDPAFAACLPVLPIA